MPCEQKEETPVSSGASAQRRRILVIDDDLDTRTILHDLLQSMGFDVVAASSGHHGLALIEDHASKGYQIDGILLNWKMPGFNGMTVFRKLQKRHAEIPVIVMTVLSQIERIDWFEDMMRKGARDCILKPLDINLLWEKCSRHFMPPSQ